MEMQNLKPETIALNRKLEELEKEYLANKLFLEEKKKMEAKEILKGNKLIAEFMGGNYDSTNTDYWFNISEKCLSNWTSPFAPRTIDLKFHSSRVWLMPVVKKIESIGYRWEIGMSTTSPYHYCKIWSIGIIERISPLDAVYGAIIEFIKWYNTCQK